MLSKTTSGKPLVNIDERNGVRRFIQPSLRRRFFLHNFLRFLMFCLIPVLMLGSLSIFITDRYIGDGIEADNEQTLHQYSNFLQIIVGEMDSLSLSFDQDPKIMMMLKRVLTQSSLNYDEREALFYLRNVIDVPANSKPYIHSIYIYYDNPERRFLSTREGRTDLDTFFDRSWFTEPQRQANGAELTTTVRRIQEFNIKDTVDTVITVSRPIAAGKGMIVANVAPAYFEQSIAALRKFPDQTVLITDSSGQPILYSGTSDNGLESENAVFAGSGAAPVGGTLPEQRRLAAVDSGKPFSYIENGQHVTMMPIPRLGWLLITAVPNASLYGPVQTLTQITLLLSLCSVLISALLAVWMTRKHYRQVSGILHALNAAELQHPLSPGDSGRARDVYELIIRNILDTFLQQRYLKVQLSERRYREEVLELRALQSQMNPHFLSNTLHSVYWKSVELTRSPNAVSSMIERLSDMLEYAVRTSEELVTLEEELLYCRNYVDIQLMRHPSRLKVDWEPIEGCEACEVLKLSLQPIIENSIQYGLEEGDAGALRIRVRFRMSGSCLKVTVLDNGPGITAQRLAELELRLTAEEEPAAHVGLTNTFRRLGLKYGSQSRLRIVSKPQRGTAVTLFFPQLGR